jgi:hypothetical protein
MRAVLISFLLAILLTFPLSNFNFKFIPVAASAAVVQNDVILSGSVDHILGPQAPITSSWYNMTALDRGKFHGRNFSEVPPTGAAIDPYVQNNYYDLALALAINYRRTGDSEFLALFRKVTDSWWKVPGWIDEGRLRQFDTQGTAPRNVSMGGLIIRAMDGRPEMWDWINAYTRYHFNLWLKSRINDSEPYLGVRDGAFSLQYAAWLAKLLPDSFPLQSGGVETNGAAIRAQYLADIEAIVLNYYGRLQYADGSWRWSDPYYVDADGGHLKGIMQPFQVGLLLDALIDAYNVTSNETVKASIVTQVTKACRHLYSDGPYTTQKLQALNILLRGFHYFYHGGTSNNPTKYERGDLPADWNPTSSSDVQNQRQAIGLIVAAFGWSYQRTGDPFFKQAGDDLWDAAYGDTDGVHNYMAGDAKSYNQNSRWAGNYLVWAGQPTAPVPLPSSTPTPIPLPTSSPTPLVESAEGTRLPPALQIIDKAGAIWTRASNGAILRNGVSAEAGAGSEIRYCSSTVYVFGTDSQWWRWSGGWVPQGSVVPCGLPTPTPTPIPSPTPLPSPSLSPTCLMTAPASVTIPRKGSQTVGLVFSGITTEFEVRAVPSSGQVTVQPVTRRVIPPSSSLQFLLTVKQSLSSVRFDSPCGSKTIQVIVR